MTLSRTCQDQVTVATADLAAGLKQVVRAASGDDVFRFTGVLMSAEDGVCDCTPTLRLAVRHLPEATVLRRPKGIGSI